MVRQEHQLNEANLGVHFAETVMRRCLCQDVHRLLSGVDGLDLHPSFLDALSNVVISCVNMFATILEDRIFTELNGGLVVDL
jgi:hypothetical protein